MTLLTWKAEYSVGVESVDFEHQEMIGLINTIYEEIEDKKNPQSIEHFLGEVHATISAHFALEERVMRNANYDEFEAHKDDHEELLDQIRTLMDEFFEVPEKGLQLLQENLSDWFAGHFATFDARLHGKLDMPHH
jgi:hemerythrin-like metal-binding protein